MTKEKTIYTVLPLNSEMFLEMDDTIIRALEQRDSQFAQNINEIDEIKRRNPTVRNALDFKVVSPFTEDDVRDIIRIHELYWLNNTTVHAAFYHAGVTNAMKMMTGE